MVQEELDKAGKTPEAADKPVDVALTEAAEAEAESAKKLARAGEGAVREIQKALELKDAKAMQSAAALYIEKAAESGMSREQAVAVLKAQLEAYHDSYFEAGLKEKAAEIRSFGDSLAASSEIKTEAGQGFIAALDAGTFANQEAAMNALEATKDQALKAGVSEEALNAEFNLLYAAVNKKFEGQKTTGGTDAFGEGDIDDLLGGFGETPESDDVKSDSEKAA